MAIIRTSAVFPRCLVLALTGLVGACDDDRAARTNGSVNHDGGQTDGTGGTGIGGGAGGGGAGGAGGAFVDTDVVLARFNPDGTADTAFGNARTGVVRLDLGSGIMMGTSAVRDAPWGLAKDAQDRLIVFSARKSTGAGRVDADRVAVRLSSNGVVDATFGDAGFQTLSIGTLSDAARNGIVDPDGKIVTAGYTNQPTGVGTQTANRLVLARLHGGTAAGAGGAGGRGTAGATGAAGAAGAGGAAGASGVAGAGGTAAAGGTAGAAGAGGASGGAATPAPGTLDNSFGVMGVVNYNPFSSSDPLKPWGVAEAYGIARQSTGAYVTAGYGGSMPAAPANVVSFRFTASGAFDTTWGNSGIFERDIASDNDRARNIVTLPGDRLLLVGSATPTASNVDAMVMILTPNGVLDPSFNTTGYKMYKFDATTDRADEALYGAAVSPNNMFAAAAGYRRASGTTSTAASNDDATLVILPLGTTGTEFAAAVPLSMTADDRFWSVTFDANNKIVAAGYVAEGTDRWLAVARFNTDGTPDTAFGTAGLARINARVGGNLEEARGVIVQSDGKIVVVGSAEH